MVAAQKHGTNIIGQSQQHKGQETQIELTSILALGNADACWHARAVWVQ